jgi:hypothetical protein
MMLLNGSYEGSILLWKRDNNAGALCAVVLEMREGNGAVWSTVPWIMDHQADRVRLPILR